MEIQNVQLQVTDENLKAVQDFKPKVSLSCTCDGGSCQIIFKDEGGTNVFEMQVKDLSQVCQSGLSVIFLCLPKGIAVITTENKDDATSLFKHLCFHVECKESRQTMKQSVFSLSRDEASVKNYFQFYSSLTRQQVMLQDSVRTSIYRSAILENPSDFKDKVVLDVGAGTGILSFFALQAGARKVYAIEASNMAMHCQQLVKYNNFTDKMDVIVGKVEEVHIPEEVDIIISEPMGYMLYSERMLESYLHAKKWLKPGGKMFPSKANFYIAPFSDDALYMEQYKKAKFWTQTNFHDVNLSGRYESALNDIFRQIVRDTFDVRILVAKPSAHETDFLLSQETDLHRITIPVTFTLCKTGLIHGLAFWFNVAFCGSESVVWLSTAPFKPLTHWHQMRCLFQKPIDGTKGQELSGVVTLTVNKRLSYDVTVELGMPGTQSTTNNYDLTNPIIRYVKNPAVQVPKLSIDHTNPTESYFDSNDIEDIPVDTLNGDVAPAKAFLVPSIGTPTSTPNFGGAFDNNK